MEHPIVEKNYSTLHETATEVPTYLSQCSKQLGLSEQRMLQICKRSNTHDLRRTWPESARGAVAPNILKICVLRRILLCAVIARCCRNTQTAGFI